VREYDEKGTKVLKMFDVRESRGGERGGDHLECLAGITHAANSGADVISLTPGGGCGTERGAPGEGIL